MRLREFSDRQCLGCGIGETAARTWLFRIGHLFRSGSRLVGKGRWRGYPGRGVDACEGDRRCGRLACFRRSGKLFRRPAGGRRADYRHGGGNRPRRRSIEDATGDPTKPLYDAGFAAERVAAAVAAARAAGLPFVLTARTESFLYGNTDLADVVRRLQAFEAAGADVLMAPGLPDLDAVRAVCAAVTKPVNFMAGIRGKSFTVKELTDAGVKRISFATSLFRVAMTGVMAAATEVRDRGTFTYLDHTMPTGEWNRFMAGS